MKYVKDAIGVSISWRERSDWRNLQKMSREIGHAADKTTLAAANEIKRYIRENWSPSSPSAPGKPPAKVTGNLDRSLFVEKYGASGKELSARAGGRDVYMATLIVDTRRGPRPWRKTGDPYEVNYGLFMEEGVTKSLLGDIAPRPFLEPAVEDYFATGAFKRKFVSELRNFHTRFK
jgi:hypothetical protein